MKLVFIISMLLSTSQLYAHSPHFSTGTGFACEMTFRAVPLLAHGCKAQLITELQTENGVAHDGQIFQTVIQQYDGTQCLETYAAYSVQRGEGDLSKNPTFSFIIPSPRLVATEPTALYINSKGFSDVEFRGEVQTYIYKEGLPMVVKADQLALSKLQPDLFNSVQLSYNDQSKILAADISTVNGVFHSEKTADFAKGIQEAPVALVVTILKNIRNYTLNISCVPFSAPNP